MRLGRFWKMYYKYLFSYLSITIALIVFMGISISKISDQKITAEVYSEKMKRLTYLVQLSEDSYLRPVENIAYSYSFNSLVDSRSIISKLLRNGWTDNLTAVRSLCDQLKSEKIAMKDIKEITLYFKQKDFIVQDELFLTDTDRYDDAAFLKSLVPDSKTADGVWLERGSRLTYVCTLPYAATGDAVLGYIVIDIEKEDLSKALNALLIPNVESLYVVNEDDTPVLEPENVPYSGETVEQLLEEDDETFKIQSVEGNDTVIASMQGKSMRYIILSSVDYFYSLTRDVRQSIIIFCIFDLAIGVLFALFYSWSFYSPVKKLMQMFQNGKEARTGEFVFIHDQIAQLNGEIGALETKLQSNRYYLLLVNTFEETSFQDHEKIFPYPNFVAATCRLHNASFPDLRSRMGNERSYIVMQIYMGDNLCAYIINTYHESEEIQEKLCEIWNQEDGVIGVGGIAQDISGVHQSYKQAQSALDYRFLRHSNEVIFFDIIDNLPEFKFTSNWDRFQQAFLGGDFPYLEDYYESILTVLENQMYEISSVKYFFFKVIFHVEKLLHLSDTTAQLEINESLHSKFLQMEDYRQAVEWLKKITLGAMKIQKERSKNNSAQAMSRVSEYIHAHLEEDLSLTQLAEIAGLTPSYVSSLFKKYYDVGVVEYINRTRLNQAALLLRSSLDKNVDDIAGLTGYSNTGYFIRKFGQMFGVTPLGYREQYLQEASEKLLPPKDEEAQ